MLIRSGGGGEVTARTVRASSVRRGPSRVGVSMGEHGAENGRVAGVPPVPAAAPEGSGDANVTAMLQGWREGDPGAPDALMRALYAELHALAAQRVRAAPGSTLNATDLIHEAFLKLVHAPARSWENRRHFVAAAGAAMRSVLVDRARARGAIKRGGERRRVPLELAQPATEDEVNEHLLEVHGALTALEAEDARAAQVVTLRFFAGLTEQEVAQVLGVTERTVRRDWVFARAWLARRLGSAA
jgi:RNA polymerase sigma factor (TIGR02999 family)